MKSCWIHPPDSLGNADGLLAGSGEVESIGVDMATEWAVSCELMECKEFKV